MFVGKILYIVLVVFKSCVDEGKNEVRKISFKDFTSFSFLKISKVKMENRSLENKKKRTICTLQNLSSNSNIRSKRALKDISKNINIIKNKNEVKEEVSEVSEVKEVRKKMREVEIIKENEVSQEQIENEEQQEQQEEKEEKEEEKSENNEIKEFKYLLCQTLINSIIHSFHNNQQSIFNEITVAIPSLGFAREVFGNIGIIKFSSKFLERRVIITHQEISNWLTTESRIRLNEYNFQFEKVDIIMNSNDITIRAWLTRIFK